MTTRATEESFRKGQGVPSFDERVEATLTPDGEQTIPGHRGARHAAGHAPRLRAGWQIHAENLAAHFAGRRPVDAAARWEELAPSYRELAAGVN